MKPVMEYQDLGTIPYKEAWRLQDELRVKRIADEIPDRLLLVEHPPVFTIGWRESEGDFLSPRETIAADGIEIVKTNRGGRITYHGPGQMVGYFIVKLEALGIGIKELVRAIEEGCLRLLAGCGIEAAREPQHPGIWVGRMKIAAIGLHVQHGVTEHGVALNVAGDLKPYRHIVACGIRDRGVTSMAQLLATPPAMTEVKREFVRQVGDVLSKDLVERNTGASAGQ